MNNVVIRIPYAAREVIPMGAGNAYVLYKQFLQLLSYQLSFDESMKHELTWSWMLKCPFHLPYLSELFKVFPDATLVWTHRNPVECVASACSLYDVILEMGAHSDSIDRNALGQAVLDYTEMALSKAQQSLEAIKLGFTSNHSTSKDQKGGIKVIHVRYQDNIKNSKKICQDILEQVCILIFFTKF
jgi:hypothetical protein